MVLLRALGMQANVGSIVGVERIIHAHLQGAEGVARTYLLPSCTGPPSVTIGGTVLERAVLH